METKQMTFEEWFDKYKPLLNPLNKVKKEQDDEDYQVYWGTLEENDFLNDNKGESRIWTVVEGDRDSLYLQSGYHRVNRMYHFVTEVPYEEEFQIEIWEGYPIIEQEDLDNLNKIIERYEAEHGSEDKKVLSANKIAEYIHRVGLN